VTSYNPLDGSSEVSTTKFLDADNGVLVYVATVWDGDKEVARGFGITESDAICAACNKLP